MAPATTAPAGYGSLYGGGDGNSSVSSAGAGQSVNTLPAQSNGVGSKLAANVTSSPTLPLTSAAKTTTTTRPSTSFPSYANSSSTFSFTRSTPTSSANSSAIAPAEFRGKAASGLRVTMGMMGAWLTSLGLGLVMLGW